MPRTSVIIATHNRPALLPRAVESAKGAGANLEIVVVDDASSDETAEVCRRLTGITYVRLERNLGVAGARNLGILASQGEYLNFLDDDDVRLPGSLDIQADALASAPEAGLVYGQALVGDKDCVPTAPWYPVDCPQGDVFWNLLGRNFIPCGSALFRRSCLYRVGLLDDQVSGVDDWDLWVRIAELYPVLVTPQPVMIWRRSAPSSGQGTSQAAELARLCTRQFRERWSRLPRAACGPLAESRKAWRRFSDNMARHLIFEASRALTSNYLQQFIRDLSVALLLHPFGLTHLIKTEIGKLLSVSGSCQELERRVRSH